MNQPEAHLHSRCTVHFCPSLSPRPSDFSEGLVPRLGCEGEPGDKARPLVA